MSKYTYIVYETTNTINGKYYIGVHKINNSNYLGSGILLKRAIKKYSRNNFIRETLKSFDNKSDAYSFEQRIIDRYLIKSPNCYNMTEGGNGGYVGKYHKFWTDRPKSWNINHSNKMKGINNPNSKHNKPISNNSKKCCVHGITFNSLADAGSMFDVHFSTIKYWIKTNKPHCYFVR